VACVAIAAADTKGTTLRGFTFSSDVQGERLRRRASPNSDSLLRTLPGGAQQQPAPPAPPSPRAPHYPQPAFGPHTSSVKTPNPPPPHHAQQQSIWVCLRTSAT